MKRSGLTLILLISNLFLLAPFAIAQSSTGSIAGTVVDENGAVIPNAKIRATLSGKSGEVVERKTATNDYGAFSFTALPFGIYDLELKVDWADITLKKRVDVNSTTSPRINDWSIVFTLEGCSGDEEGVVSSVTGEDKAEIIREMLKLLLEKHTNMFMQEQVKSKFILSTKNIESNWISSEQKQKFVLMKQSEIQDRADTNRDFLYLSFSELKVKGNCVATSLNNIWAVGKNSAMGYLSGGGHTYEFRKLNGRWIGKHVIGWIS